MTFILEVIGTVTFAFAGAMIGIDNDLDFFGINVAAVATATGGGMTRDIILGNTPPMLFRDPTFFTIALVSSFITIGFYQTLSQSKYKNSILFIINTLDAVGLAIFTIVGMQIARDLNFGDNMFLVIFVGALSAVGGGLLRDIMVNRTPVILQKEVYATASIIGAVVYYILWNLGNDIIAVGIPLVLIFGIRMWAITKNVNLPYVKKNDKNK